MPPRPMSKPLCPARRLDEREVPVDLPSFTLSRWSVGDFNEIYFRKGAAAAGKTFLSDADPFILSPGWRSRLEQDLWPARLLIPCPANSDSRGDSQLYCGL